MRPQITQFEMRQWRFTKTNPQQRSDRMGYIQMPNGAINYYNGAYSYSAEHGAVYNNQHEETELINSIID